MVGIAEVKMSNMPKLADPGGWRDFHYTLIQSDDNKPMLVADAIIRQYMGYLSQCRMRNIAEKSFQEWMTTPDRPAKTKTITRGE